MLAGHEAVRGRNPFSIYLNCRACKKSAVWKKHAQPTFRQYPELRYLEGLWEKLHAS